MPRSSNLASLFALPNFCYSVTLQKQLFVLAMHNWSAYGKA